MTNTSATPKKHRILILPSYRKAAVWLMTIFIIFLFFKSSEAAAKYVGAGVLVCTKSLIPSLFPFMVVSSLFVSSGLDSFVGRTLGRPLGKLLGLSGKGAGAVLIGFACGFPVGARCGAQLVLSGKISREEFVRILCICSVPSAPFLIRVLGNDMLGSALAGGIVWLSCILSALTVGIFLARVKPIKKESSWGATQKTSLPRFSEALTYAIKDGARGMFYVCAFVIFFSAFLGALEDALSPLAIGNTENALLFSVFELTSGIKKVCALDTSMRLPLCALCAGWSGLSVHFQTMAISGGTGVRFFPYVLSHLVRSLLSFLFVLLFCALTKGPLI